MGNIKKKIQSLLTNGTDPVALGMRNYNSNIPEVEEIARQRLDDCSECLVKEPIDFLRIPDDRIPELDKRMCQKCGCAAPFLFRQSLKKCENWTK